MRVKEIFMRTFRPLAVIRIFDAQEAQRRVVVVGVCVELDTWSGHCSAWTRGTSPIVSTCQVVVKTESEICLAAYLAQSTVESREHDWSRGCGALC